MDNNILERYFTFYVDYDCRGYNILQDVQCNRVDMLEMAKIALENDNCQGFNIMGEFKGDIPVDKLEKLPYLENICGIYIKKTYLESLKIPQAKKIYYTIDSGSDGFGSQYQKIIYAMLYGGNKGYTYVHTPIKSMEHNYDNDPSFLDNIERLMNLKDKYNKGDVTVKYTYNNIFYHIENNIDQYLETNAMNSIRSSFWENKDRDFFKNGLLNIAVHVRRKNKDDNRDMGSRVADRYYLDLMKDLREGYNDKSIMFHIYSQGDPVDFEIYNNSDVTLHIGEPVWDTFTGMVAADVLVMSASLFSYSAAFLSTGVKYYFPFWIPPSKKWLIHKDSNKYSF